VASLVLAVVVGSLWVAATGNEDLTPAAPCWPAGAGGPVAWPTTSVCRSRAAMCWSAWPRALLPS
ncbi:MAG: hypothetical protein ACRD1K_06000, partial [Acidimicrobiales bacterium]